MPDQEPPSSAAPPLPPKLPESKPLPHLADEFGTAAKNLPPVKIVLIGVGVVVAVALIAALLQRPHASASGAIGNVVAVEVPGQGSVMVAISFSIHNQGKKPFWVHNVEADLDTDSGKFTDEAAAAVDFDRYFQAFPALKENSYPALKRETMIAPGGETQGTIIVSFPVTLTVYNSRKSLTVTIRPYDQPVPLVLSK
jgi:hypothetical protein